MKKFLPLLALLMAGCILEDAPAPTVAAEVENESESQQQMVLGRRLENPYSVANMRKAYAALPAQTRAESGFEEDEITTTHRYVKFMPQDDAQSDILLADSTLMLFTFPLDYEVVQAGEYIDPEMPEGTPIEYYASVPEDKVLPEQVPYEIIEDLFIPDDYDDQGEPVTRAVVGLDIDFIEQLVFKSLEMTGNLEPGQTRAATRASKWRPAGKITYYDDILKETKPLQGVEIRATRWFSTHSGTTVADGSYSCNGTFRYSADYKMLFRSRDFKVKNGSARAKITGAQNTRSKWNRHIDRTKDGMHYFHTTIFRAAHRYYYENIDGLTRPPQKRVLYSLLKIRTYFNSSERSYYNSTTRKAFIYNNGTTEDLFAVTIHELAHAAHHGMYSSVYNGANAIVKESWAQGVQHILTRKTYPNYKDLFDRGIYTGIVLDLMDPAGLKKYCNTYRTDPNGKRIAVPDNYIDNVAGYKLTEIQNAALTAKTWNAFQTNLKTYKNDTKDNLAESFSFWANRRWQ